MLLGRLSKPLKIPDPLVHLPASNLVVASWQPACDGNTSLCCPCLSDNSCHAGQSSQMSSLNVSQPVHHSKPAAPADSVRHAKPPVQVSNGIHGAGSSNSRPVSNSRKSNDQTSAKDSGNRISTSIDHRARMKFVANPLFGKSRESEARPRPCLNRVALNEVGRRNLAYSAIPFQSVNFLEVPVLVRGILIIK